MGSGLYPSDRFISRLIRDRSQTPAGVDSFLTETIMTDPLFHSGLILKLHLPEPDSTLTIVANILSSIVRKGEANHEHEISDPVSIASPVLPDRDKSHPGRPESLDCRD